LENIMGQLSLENVSVQYQGTNKFAIENITFTLNKGEIVGLLGHNGAGKTTTLECLAGLIQPTKGVRKVTEKLVYVPSDLYLYNMLTVEETLLFVGRLHGMPKKQIIERADFLLEVFDLSEKKHIYTKELSFGMKNKLALITGILPDPQVLLLDEPMTGFDALSTKKTKDFLLQFMSNDKTILLSSHRLDIVEDICERILVINKGKLIFDGDILTLKEQQNVESNLESALLKLTNPIEEDQGEENSLLLNK